MTLKMSTYICIYSYITQPVVFVVSKTTPEKLRRTDTYKNAINTYIHLFVDPLGNYHITYVSKSSFIWTLMAHTQHTDLKTVAELEA
jgi:hypothetical protein